MPNNYVEKLIDDELGPFNAIDGLEKTIERMFDEDDDYDPNEYSDGESPNLFDDVDDVCRDD